MCSEVILQAAQVDALTSPVIDAAGNSPTQGQAFDRCVGSGTSAVRLHQCGADSCTQVKDQARPHGQAAEEALNTSAAPDGVHEHVAVLDE